MPLSDVSRALPTARRRSRTALRLVASLGVLATVLSGCTTDKVQTTPAAAATSADGATATVAELYAQTVSWTDCGADQCATVAAPLDWDDESLGTIELAVQRQVATGSDRQGSLLLNPGGPGQSGIDFLGYAVSDVIGADVQAAYDVVTFDPRGTGGSTAVRCGGDAAVDGYLTADVEIRDQADLDAARSAVAEVGQGCLDATGALLGHVDTVSAAKDMDLLRALVGDERLNYLGFSYGTFLGATYAELFPERVGRFVLDGALDPSSTNDELALEQAAGFEASLRAYVADCQAARGCPLTGSVDDGVAQIRDLVDRARATPLTTGDGYTVNGTLAFYGIIVTLYDDSYWPYLTQALTEAITQNTGATLFQLANLYLDRTPDGTYTSNAMMAFTAINCLDYPSATRSYDELLAFEEKVATVAPTFADQFSMVAGCETWPEQATREPAEIHAAGAGPILVVGTTGDPATPYAWAQALADAARLGPAAHLGGRGPHRLRPRRRLRRDRGRGLPAGRDGPRRRRHLLTRFGTPPDRRYSRRGSPLR